MPKSPMVKVGGLWLNKTKDGDKYFSGSIGGLKILLFKSKSDHPQAPYYNMFLAEKEQDKQGYKRRGDDEGEEKVSRYQAKAPDDFGDDEDEAPKKTKAEEDDDLPF